MNVPRRRLLAAAGGALATLAGCVTSGPAGDDATNDSTDGTPTDTPGTGTPGPRLPVSGRWPQRGFDAGHSGVGPRTGVPEDARVFWRHRRIRSGPALLDGDRLYHYAELGDDPGGTATPTPSPSTGGGPAHIVDGNPHLVARDAATGALAWWTSLANTGGGWPALVDGRVVATVPGEVVAVDPASGQRRWTDGFDPVAHGEGTFPRPVGDPTVAGDAVVVPLTGVVDGGEYVVEPKLRAYDRDGTERWTVRMPKRGLGVAAGDGAAVVVANDWESESVVQARSLADGSVRWEREIPGSLPRNPVVADGTTYVAAGGTLVALDATDGGVRWRARTGSDHGVAADGGAVYAAAEDVLVKLDATDGSERWRVPAGDQESYVAPPAVGNGVVYAGSFWGHLRALDAATGDELWVHRFPETTVEGDMVMAGVRTRPTLGDGAVYVDAVDGLYGFGPAEG